jgi:acyl dehydratase
LSASAERPAVTRAYEDFGVGDSFELGTYDVTEAEILEFAERYDPQWFHTQPERARSESIYGGLIASGWHTAAMTMRLLVDGLLADTDSHGAKGVDELRWRRPVVPGDRLSATAEVVERIPERPERGIVRLSVTTTNGDGADVFSMIGNTMVARRASEE